MSHHEDDGHGDSRVHDRGAEIRVLRATFLLKFGILIVQLLGVVLSGSLALLGDCGHLAFDMAANLVGWWQMRYGQRAATRKEQLRSEARGSRVIGGLIFGAGFLLSVSALSAFQPHHIVHGEWMASFAVAGLFVNAWNLKKLHKYRHIHLVGDVREHEGWDFASSAAVVIAGVLIFARDLAWLDTLVAIGIGLMMMGRGAVIVWRTHPLR